MNAPQRVATQAAFVQGSVFRHVAVMTLTSSIGLMAIFLIDLLSMFYISLAHRDDWRAAVALVSKVLFFPFALNMGMMVGIGTVVSIAIGRGDCERARRLATTGLVLTASLGLAVSIAAFPFRIDILRMFGAEGEALDAAARLLRLMLPVNVLLAIGMACAGILRACGDPIEAMLVTLAGAVAIAVLDPFFIFYCGLGVDGVGAAILVSRIVFVVVGLWGVVHGHRIVAAPRWPRDWDDIRSIALVAVPAMTTNLALPLADWYVTRTIWHFGVAASAAAGVYDRIMPLAFSLVFALSPAIGPIVGQNLGACAFDRVRMAFVHALTIAGLYGLAVWLLVWIAAPSLATAFGLSGGAAAFFLFLCRFATIAWFSVGLMMVANAIFNTLGRAQVATWFSWGRATLGTIPFVWLGARSGSVETATLGAAAAAALFAIAALWIADRYIRQLGRQPAVT